ncbi:AAA family ATPase [Candidatus Micrarchaeota archaeon]|nr:AAA family ATPase [Candidatus Micrarchaeota archaeon]
MITKLKLRHFKSHELTEVEFFPGTSIIVGSMGSGKTSIAEAICFGLFGTTPGLKNRRVKLADLVMQRPSRHFEASVELSIELDGQAYSIDRQIKEGAATAYLRSGGKLIDTGSERVTEAVERLIKTDYELFSRAIYSEQNNLDYFLTLGKGERKRQIDQLLGIDRLEAARANAASLSNKLKARRDEAKSFLAGMDYAGTEKEFIAGEAKRNSLSHSLADAEGKLQHRLQQIETAASQLAELELKSAEFNSLEKQAASAESTCRSLEEEMARWKASASRVIDSNTREKVALEKAHGVKRLAELKSSLASMRQLRLELEKARGQLVQVDAELASLSSAPAEHEALLGEKKAQERLTAARAAEGAIVARFAEVKARLDSIAQEMEVCKSHQAQLGQISVAQSGLEKKIASLSSQDWDKAVSELRTAIAAKEAAIQSASKALEALGRAGATCPVCLQPLHDGERHNLVGSNRESVESGNAQLSALNAQFSSAQQSLQALQSASNELAMLRQKAAFLEPTASKAARLESELAAAKKSFHELSEEAKAAASGVSECESRLRLASATLEHSRKKSALGQGRVTLLASAEGISQRLSLSGAADENEVAAFEAGLRAFESAEFYFTAKEKLDSLLAARRETGARMEKLKSARGELDALRRKQSEFMEEKGRLESGCESLRRELEAQQALVTSLEARLKSAGERKRRVERIDSLLNGVAKFQSALLETQTTLRTELVLGVNEVMEGLWRNVYPYSDYTAVRLQASEDDYSLELRAIDGGWVAVENASGGERACAVLCLRVSFAVILAPRLGWLILDEPTHNLDTQAVTLLSRALREQIPQLVSQTFIITHDEALREAASARVYKVERDKQNGERSSVEVMAA